MDPREIFDLIVKADDALKYATEDKTAVRARQARHLLMRARDEATAIGNAALVEQAERRLADLDAAGLGEDAVGRSAPRKGSAEVSDPPRPGREESPRHLSDRFPEAPSLDEGLPVSGPPPETS